MVIEVILDILEERRCLGVVLAVAVEGGAVHVVPPTLRLHEGLFRSERGVDHPVQGQAIRIPVLRL